MQYCCFVVSGHRGSASGGGRWKASSGNSDAASFVSLQPIFTSKVERVDCFFFTQKKVASYHREMKKYWPVQ